MAQHHQHPVLSVVIGGIIGVYNSIINFGTSGFGLELTKVIIFGIIGGAAGYLGKNIASKIQKKLKNFFKK